MRPAAIATKKAIKPVPELGFKYANALFPPP